MKVKINKNPVANGYASANERIVEFSAGTDGAGGLISFAANEDGTIGVHVYRQEKTVVTVGTAVDLDVRMTVKVRGWGDTVFVVTGVSRDCRTVRVAAVDCASITGEVPDEHVTLIV